MEAPLPEIGIFAVALLILNFTLILIYSIKGAWRAFHRKEHRLFWVIASAVFFFLGSLFIYSVAAAYFGF